MNFSFDIRLCRCGYGGFIYAVHIENDPENLLDKFLRNPVNMACPEYSKLKARLEQMADRQGFRKGFFKHKESSPMNTIAALHYESQALRLYCYWTSQFIIIGGGGTKGEGSYQNYPECYNAVKILEYIDPLIVKRLKDSEIIILPSGELKGNLRFPIEI